VYDDLLREPPVPLAYPAGSWGPQSPALFSDQAGWFQIWGSIHIGLLWPGSVSDPELPSVFQHWNQVGQLRSRGFLV